MTNREKYAEEILDIACNYGGFAVDIKTNKPLACSLVSRCYDCKLSLYNNKSAGYPSCEPIRKQWSEQEYTEPSIDWSKVEVDTPILVRNSECHKWAHRYFAWYEHGDVLAWRGGCTSWTSNREDTRVWKYAKLAESEAKEDE